MTPETPVAITLSLGEARDLDALLGAFDTGLARTPEADLVSRDHRCRLIAIRRSLRASLRPADPQEDR